MITDILAGSRFLSGHSRLWTAGLLLCVVTATGCPRMVSIDYQPTNPLRGQGTVGTAPFRYQASDEQLVRPRQVETNSSAKTVLFLTQEIGVFFSEALRLELGRSGYQLKEPSDRIVSGAITRFYLDWRSGEDRSFELAATYTVQSGERTIFSWDCSSVQTGPNMLVEDSVLIRKGMADCMHRFIEAAQEAKVF
jgi:hypothetical protein